MGSSPTTLTSTFSSSTPAKTPFTPSCSTNTNTPLPSPPPPPPASSPNSPPPWPTSTPTLRRNEAGGAATQRNHRAHRVAGQVGQLLRVQLQTRLLQRDNHLRNTFCGTPLYFSPEILSSQSYDETVDIWAVGVLTYELLTGSNPFNIKRLTEIGKIVSEQVNLNKIEHYQAREFIGEMLIKERVLRKSMGDLLSHPFLALAHERN